MEDLDQMEVPDPMEHLTKDQGKLEEDQLGIIMEEDLVLMQPDHQTTLLAEDHQETPMVEGPTVLQDPVTLVDRGQEIMEVIMEEGHQEMEATPMVSGLEDHLMEVLDPALDWPGNQLVAVVQRRRAGEESR